MRTREINKILVPIDFSQRSENALEVAIAICKQHRATLTLFHIVESTANFRPKAGIAAPSVLPELVKRAGQQLSELAKNFRDDHDLVVNHIVLSGKPADEIAAWASKRNVDLIVMGSYGKSTIRQFLMGSTAYRVIKNSPCPVLTVPGKVKNTDLKKIVFPVRMVPHALDKYEFIKPFVQSDGSAVSIAGIVKKNDIESVPEMEELVKRVKTRMEIDNIACDGQVYVCENPARQVNTIADRESPDLIAITTTPDTSLKDFFLGPYTQDIVNTAKVPVLSVRPAQRDDSSTLDTLLDGIPLRTDIYC